MMKEIVYDLFRNDIGFFSRHDLAELLLKLRQYDKAEKVLKQSLEADSGEVLKNHLYKIFSSIYNYRDYWLMCL